MRMHPVSRGMLGCGLAWLLSASIGQAQPMEPKLPDGLRHVPLDAVGFVHVRAGDFLKSAIAQDLLKEMKQDREASKGLKKIEQTLGVEVANLDSVTFLLLPPPTGNPMMPRTRPAFEQRFPPPGIKKNFEDKERTIERPPFRDKDFEEPKEGRFNPVSFQDGFEQPFPDGGTNHEMDFQNSSGPLVVVTSTKPLDRKQILRGQMAAGERDYAAWDNGLSMLFLSDRSVMLGNAVELSRYAEMMARNPGPKAKPMEKALVLAAKPHTVVAGGYLPAPLRRMMLTRMMGPDSRVVAPLMPLFLTQAGLALDLGKSLELTFTFQAPTEASAGNALQAVKNLRTLAEMLLEKPQGGGPASDWKADFQKAMVKALADAVIEQKGTTVHAQLKLEASPTLVQRALKDVIATVRQKGDRTQSVNNLKQIGLALHSYHDVNRGLPPAGLSNVKDFTGKPLLSWRVAILPYIDQGPLFNEFDLTQSWDHPTNKKLIPRMPRVYMLPGVETKEEGMTHYRVLVGPQTMFEPGQRITLVSVTDGTSNTIMAVEAKEPTIWTRPDDLAFDPKGPLPKFGVAPDGFLALFGDATVRFIRAGTSDAMIRAFITRNGGEVVTLPDQ